MNDTTIDTPLTDAAVFVVLSDKEQYGERVEVTHSYFSRQLERRAIAAEQRLAESDALIKQVQREWLGGKYGVMQFCDGVLARINDVEKLLDEWREVATKLKYCHERWESAYDEAIDEEDHEAKRLYRALVEREKGQ